MDNKPFRQGTIDQFLDDLGSKKAAPGGGAAAGLVGAQACALAEMVCHLTEANKNYAEFHEKAAEYAAVFQMARSIFLDLMDEDAKSFLELMNTLRAIRHASAGGETGKTARSLQESDRSPAADGADHERSAPELHKPAPQRK